MTSAEVHYSPSQDWAVRLAVVGGSTAAPTSASSSGMIGRDFKARVSANAVVMFTHRPAAAADTVGSVSPVSLARSVKCNPRTRIAPVSFCESRQTLKALASKISNNARETAPSR
jgi:hypothetical protein